MSLAGSDLNLLNTLRVLLEERNVTRAGIRLGMSQPTMSGALSKLRRLFNDELLVRSGRDFELTPLAIEMLPAISQSVQFINAAFGLAPGFDPATSERTFRVVCSDYALSVISGPLRNRLRRKAPGVRVEFHSLDNDARGSDRAILDHDVLVGPLGYGFPGEPAPFFRDEIVCIVDRSNPLLVAGHLSRQALNTLPHAVASFGRRNLTPIDRVLGEHGITRHSRLAVWGYLPLPFVVAGTDMVGMVPKRVARMFARDEHSSVVCATSPLGRVDLIEGYWYQASKAAESGHRWFLSVLDAVAVDLAFDDAPTDISKSSLMSSDVLNEPVPVRS